MESVEMPIDPCPAATADVDGEPPTSEEKDFRVDVTTIESVSKAQQASELQPLELEVFDHATLEKGIISQVKAAIQAKAPAGDKPLLNVSISSKEEGEIDDDEDQNEEDEFSRKIRLGEVTPFDKSKEGKSLQEKAKTGFDELLQRYLENQKLQNSRKKKSSDNSPQKPRPSNFPPPKRKPKAPKEFDPNEKTKPKTTPKKEKSGKFLGTKPKKKRKKDKLGTRKSRGAARSDTALQPGEQATVNFEDSGAESEYLPSESELSDCEQPKSKKRLKNVISEVSKLSSSESETEWDSSDDELLKKRRSDKELDDGNPHYFCRRLKSVDQDLYLKELHVVMDEFKCPKIVWDRLYKYQQVAVKWFWELNQMRCGGILGDEMGLGKTIQIIAFLSGLYVSNLYDYDTGYSGLGPTLIVCPTTVMHQWVREFHKWFPLVRVAILHESGTYSTTGKEKTKLVDSIHSHDHGVMIASYTGLVQHSVKILAKQWHYVILDEGHKIRNAQAQVTTVAKQLDTPHRLILSGSPLQNNLKELWSLFDFIYPGKLGTLQVFTNVFHMPIVAGGYSNASPAQVMQAYKCAVTLKDTITPYLLRRMKRDVDAHIKLPPKTEQVLFCKLTDAQRDLYLNYLKNVNIEDMVRGNAKVFVGLIDLRKICNHPDLYSGGPSSDYTLKDDEATDENRFGYWERAGKMVVVKTLLKIWNQQKHRVLLFTQTQKMLLILEDFIKRSGYNYLKLDGNTSISARQPLIDKFNKDTSYFVMLLTTKVGGLGVNLTGANRVVIYDPDWNPATDTQARERAWRIGQERDVTIYRLVTAGTIEEKIYHRQIFKQFLSNKVLSDPKQRRFFKSNDLSELFTLNETVKDGTTETAAIFAGTGSEVKLSQLSPRKKPKLSVKEEAQDPKITFSDSKIEQMKKLAQLLSKKIADKTSPKKPEASSTKTPDDPPGNESAEGNESKIIDSTEGSASKTGENGSLTDIYGPDGQIAPDVVRNLKSVDPKTTEDGKNMPKAAETDENDNHTNKSRSEPSNGVHRKRRHKHLKRGKFEGYDVPNLVKCKKVKKSREEEEKEEAAKSQDDYVLQKLFSKSGIGTALQHDTIMQGGPHDYAIIEAEADRVAQEAIKALKESSAHVPVVRKPLFKPTAQGSALLSAIKKRNLIVDASDSENQLARNLVTYLSSKGGRSSTDQIIGEFSSKIPETQSALFKSLLGKIATFRRGSDKIGYWTLKEEFTAQNLTA